MGKDMKLVSEEFTREIIAAAIEVHKYLGPGLLESVYEECSARELELRGIQFQRQMPLKLVYKGQALDCDYRMDLVVQNKVIIELKAVDKLLPVHTAQLLTYLRLSKMEIGLLFNFNEALITEGMKRLILQKR